MSGIADIEQNTPEDSEESSYEDCDERQHVQADSEAGRSNTILAKGDRNGTQFQEISSRGNKSMTRRRKQAEQGTQSLKVKGSSLQTDRRGGQMESKHSAHIQSQSSELEDMKSYTQRRCEELEEQLRASELQKSGLEKQNRLLHEKVKLKEENILELIDQANEVQEALLEYDEKFKQAGTSPQHFGGQLNQQRIESVNPEQETCPLVEQVQALEIGIERLERLNQVAVDGRAAAEIREGKFKEAARVWKNKYSKATQERNEEIQKGSQLAEELSRLQDWHAIQDEGSLRSDLASLKYTLRDWCDRILQCKPAEHAAYFSDFPLDKEVPVFLKDLGEKELNVIIASVWEWLIELVFGCAQDGDDKRDHPDLWSSSELRSCLNYLEQQFLKKDAVAAMQWRHRTVQQLAKSDLCHADYRFSETANKIMSWVAICLKLAAPTQEVDQLKLDFENNVLKEAVEFALKLRRQNSEMSLVIPRSISRGLRSIAFAKNWKTAECQQNTLRICIGPQMIKAIPQSGSDEAERTILTEADFEDVPFGRWFSIGNCSHEGQYQEEDIEVD